MAADDLAGRTVPPLDPGFLTVLAIALKMAPRSAVNRLAGKLPHDRDAGSDALAKALGEALARSGYQIVRPPPRPLDKGK